MSRDASFRILPPELVELQIGQIDLLTAMYPDETTVLDDAQAQIDAFRAWCTGESASIPQDYPPSASLLLKLEIPDSSGASSPPKFLELDLSVPFTHDGPEPPDEPPSVKIRIRQPSWLNKSTTAQLSSEIPEDEDLFGAIEHIKNAASQRLEKLTEETQTQSKGPSSQNSSEDPLVRVWFYFPSISTRSKRDDLINHAPSYGLTGFLYAGKPGLLCVEGQSRPIDDYMKFIKTESWGDIPAQHKKVSERYRESGERVFTDMQEITDLVGERRGQRVNRGDMKALEAWLVEKGLGDAFAKVLM